MKLWTQEQSIAFESAREAISDLMGIRTGQIEDESAKAAPDDALIARYRKERSQLAAERTDLRLHDAEHVARIRSVYGGEVRAWYEQHRAAAI